MERDKQPVEASQTVRAPERSGCSIMVRLVRPLVTLHPKLPGAAFLSGCAVSQTGDRPSFRSNVLRGRTRRRWPSHQVECRAKGMYLLRPTSRPPSCRCQCRRRCTARCAVDELDQCVTLDDELLHGLDCRSERHRRRCPPSPAPDSSSAASGGVTSSRIPAGERRAPSCCGTRGESAVRVACAVSNFVRVGHPNLRPPTMLSAANRGWLSFFKRLTAIG